MLQENQNEPIANQCTQNIEGQEIRKERLKVYSFLDPNLSESHEKLNQLLAKLFLNVETTKGNLGSADFLRRVKEIESSEADVLLFFFRINNDEQVNELYGILKKLKFKKVGSVFIIFDYRKDHRLVSKLATDRYREMKADQKNKLISFAELVVNAKGFKLMVEGLGAI